MQKVLFSMLLSALSLAAFGQRVVIADTVKTKRLDIRGKKVDSVSTVIPVSSPTHREVPTDAAVKNFVWQNTVYNGAAAGGDLQGTFPTPTVDGLQGRAVASTAPATNEVLKWNGSAWTPATDAGGVPDGDKGDITVSSSGVVWGVDNDAITAAKIAADAVGSSEIAANAVNTAEIADGAVTAAKVASGVIPTLSAGAGITVGSAPNYTVTNTGDTNAGDDITGTLSSGQIPYATGAQAVAGANNLFWDATNTRLGLGTNSPSALLELKKYNASTLKITTTTGDFDQYAVLELRNQSSSAGGGRIHINTIPQPGDLADRTGIFFKDASNSDAIDFQLKYTNEGNSNASRLEFRNGSERILGFTRDKKWLLPTGGLYLDMAGTYDYAHIRSTFDSDASAVLTLNNRGALNGRVGINIEGLDASDFPDYGGRSRIQFNRKPDANTAAKLYWAISHRMDNDDFTITRFNPDNGNDYARSIVLKHATGNAVINGVTIGDTGYGIGTPCVSFLSDPSAQGTYALHQTPEGNYTLLNKKVTGTGYIGFRFNDVDKAVLLENGHMGIGTTIPAARLHVHGSGSTSGTYSAAFAGSDGLTTFCVRDDKRVGFFTGSPSAAIHASLADNSVLFDGSAATSSPATTTIFKGKTSSFSTKHASFRDESDNEIAYIQTPSGAGEIRFWTPSGKNMSLSADKVDLKAGAYTTTVAANASLDLQHVAGNVSSPAESQIWYDDTNNRLSVYTTQAEKVLTQEADLLGVGLTTRSASWATESTEFFTIVDANGGNITITLNSNLREGRTYVFKCRRNNSNTITFSGTTAGYNLEYSEGTTIPGASTLTTGGGATGFLAAYQIYSLTRVGTTVFIY